MSPEQRAEVFRIAKELNIEETEVLNVYKAICKTVKNTIEKTEVTEDGLINEESLSVILIHNFGKIKPSKRKIKIYNYLSKNRKKQK